MLPSAMDSLRSECLPHFPWHEFPFTGFIAMLASLVTLIIDFIATEYYELQHEHGDLEVSKGGSNLEPIVDIPVHAQMLYKSFTTCGSGIYSVKHSPCQVFSRTRSNFATEKDTYNEIVIAKEDLVLTLDKAKESLPEGDQKIHIIGHSHNIGTSTNEVLEHIRHVVVSQVLELGIIAHSVIIGITLGVSESPCTIRPLLAALSFHQFFEGFALGGCIAQAQFSYNLAMIMASCYAITTPTGIGIGIGISSSYHEKSARSLIVEGVFDSILGGILVYMSLVDLIATDFLSKRMRCNRKLQLFCYASLISGCFAMSALAIWT